jgi:hypothetical protein
VRRFTLITIVVLFLLIVAAAIYQLMLADGDRARFPGPVPGTPFPSTSASLTGG